MEHDSSHTGSTTDYISNLHLLFSPVSKPILNNEFTGCSAVYNHFICRDSFDRVFMDKYCWYLYREIDQRAYLADELYYTNMQPFPIFPPG